MERSKIIQVIMATHAPMLMAYPQARLLRLTSGGLDPISVEETDHFRMLKEFWGDPKGFVEKMLEE
jgi:predicted ATPase